MGEAEEVEGLWLPFAPPLTSFRRKAAEFDQASFLGVELQTELGEPLAEFRQAVLDERVEFEVAATAALWMR